MPPSSPARDRIPTDRDVFLISRRCSPVVSALVRLGLETGMRRNEMLAITRNNVDFVNRTLYIPQAKTGSRTIPLSDKAIRILKQWNCNFDIRPNSVTQNFRRVCQTLGLPFCFHTIRHRAITRFIEKGLSLPQAASISGHKDPSMLQRYVHLDPSGLAKMLN